MKRPTQALHEKLHKAAPSLELGEARAAVHRPQVPQEGLFRPIAKQGVWSVLWLQSSEAGSAPVVHTDPALGRRGLLKLLKSPPSPKGLSLSFLPCLEMPAAPA